MLKVWDSLLYSGSLPNCKSTDSDEEKDEFFRMKRGKKKFERCVSE